MSQVPVDLGALVTAPLADAVVAPVKRVPELVDLGDSGQVPQADDSLATSCEQNSLEFRVVRASIGYGKERARVAPQCNVRL